MAEPGVAPLYQVAGARRDVQHRARAAARGAWRRPGDPPRHGGRPGRRERIGQERDRAGAVAAAAAARAGQRAAAELPRRRHRDDAVRGAAAAARRPGGHDLPGAGAFVRSDLLDRALPGRDPAHASSGAGRHGAARTLGGAAEGGGHRRGGAPPGQLPAPVLRRHAATGDDRARAGGRPGGADRRRADHRARRHGCRRRWWSCCCGCARRAGWRSCSSATTWPWSARSPTAWW